MFETYSTAFRSSVTVTFSPIGEAAVRAAEGLKPGPERPAAKPSGQRKLTRADLDARRLIDDYDRREPPGPGVIRTFKKAGPLLGLTAREIHAIDQLVSFTKAQDWQGGPIIVWPSNRQLMDCLGLSKRAVQTLLTNLKERGLVAFHDGPTGSRWGKRDANGRIVEAYGIDLRPLAARAEEFQRLARQAKEERKARGKAKRRRTIARKRIEQAVDTAREQGGNADTWDAREALARDLCAGYPDNLSLAVLEDQAARLEALAEAALADLEALLDRPAPRDDSVETAPSGAIGCTPITTTTESESLFERQVDAWQGGGAAGEDSAPDGERRSGLEDPEESRTGTGTEREGPAERARRAVADHLGTYGITPAMVLRACPEVAQHVPPPNGEPGWSHLAEAGATMRHILGISQDAWKEAGHSLNPGAAGIAVAVIAQKCAYAQAGRGPDVASPGGYLRWFTREALKIGRGGKFDLGPKIYALLRQRGIGNPERGL